MLRMIVISMVAGREGIMVSSNYVQIEGSARAAPEAVAGPHGVSQSIARVKPSETIEVSVYLKGGDDDAFLAAPPVSAQGVQAASVAARSREEIRSSRAVSQGSNIAKVVEFANAMGLSVVKTDPARRLVKLAGPADKMEAAFRTKLHYYNNGATAFRARTGSLSVPEDVGDVVEAVLGLDTRPQTKPRLVAHIAPHAIGGHLPNGVAALYGFPKTAGMGKGQCIAIVELGGGYRDTDNKKAFGAMGLATPKVLPISVSGGLNKPGISTNADGEVALDIQVAGGAAPGAAIAVYFAPNTTQGFVDAITRAVHDDVNRPSVISISWGSSESHWTGQGIKAMTSALRDAAEMGVTVFAASGDDLATDGETDQRGHVDFPGSNPYAVGCGGTLIDSHANKIKAERVWNNGGSGTGGGISDVFPTPAYQATAGIPPSVNDGKVRRGVPDVAGNADPSSGYRIIMAGASGLIGGTSAVAPLWAGLFALINEQCGKPAGFIHPVLYGNPSAFQNVTIGDNKSGGIGYSAGPGWDACTGLGSPDGAALLKAFQSIGGKPAAAAAKRPAPVPAKAQRASVTAPALGSGIGQPRGTGAPARR
jgi:kumamolisin